MDCPQCFCGPSEPKGGTLWLCLGCGAFWEETPEAPAETPDEPAAEPAIQAGPKPWSPSELQMMAWEFYNQFGYYPDW
jgi:hypothetical protein